MRWPTSRGCCWRWWYILRLLKTERLWAGPPFNGKPQATADQIGDLFVWAALGVILGGRLGYVLFYGLDLSDRPFPVERRGASSTRGKAACRSTAGRSASCSRSSSSRGAKKLDMVALGDLVAAATPIGLFFGRIANFINGELWGKPTTCRGRWCFPHADALPRHPSQLYEAALEGLVLFAILYVMILRFNALRKPGLVIAVFFAGLRALPHHRRSVLPRELASARCSAAR